MQLNYAWVGIAFVSLCYVTAAFYTVYCWHFHKSKVNRIIPPINLTNCRLWISAAVVILSYCTFVAACTRLDNVVAFVAFCIGHSVYPLVWTFLYVLPAIKTQPVVPADKLYLAVQCGVYLQFAAQFIATVALLTWTMSTANRESFAVVLLTMQVCIWLYAATFDGVVYLPAIKKHIGLSITDDIFGMPTQNALKMLFKPVVNNDNAAVVHAACSSFHLLATLILLCYALSSKSLLTADVDSKFWSLAPWTQQCYDADLARYLDDLDGCDESNLVYSVLPLQSVMFKVNLLAIAAAYSTVSGMSHALMYVVWMSPAFAKEDRQLYVVRETVYRFWSDYAISAPLMLAAMNVVFGANGGMALVFSPMLLCVLLVLSPIVQLGTKDVAWFLQQTFQATGTRPNRGNRKTAAWAGFLILVVLYGVCLIPTAAAVFQSGAPVGVQLMLGSTIVLFSAFIGPYTYEMYYMYTKDARVPFYTWVFMSLNTKIILHGFFALSIFQQSQLSGNYDVVETNAEPANASMPSLTEIALVLGLVPTISTSLLCMLRFKLECKCKDNARYKVDIFLNTIK